MSIVHDPPAPPSLFDLMLEEGRTAFNERLHQRTCPARADGRECLACLQYEAEWLAADLAVSEYLVTQEVPVS
jgi:hypothetical protein